MAFDRLEAMRAFCRIVELGSFTRAADALAIAKTTLSGQIRALETQLGLKLLHRTTRRVTATTDGAAYYERARRVLEDIDCAIRGGLVTDPDLVCRPIGQMRFVLCASPFYLNEHPPVNSPQDLTQLRYLAFVFPASGRQNLVRLECSGQSVLIEQTPAMRFNSGGAYMAAAKAGLGFVALPLCEAQALLADGKLVQLLPEWHLPSMPMSLVYPYSRRLSARVRAFVEWATATMGQDPLWRL